MDLWQLKIFCSVIEQKSFSKAGRIVHLSQPTISSHIKDLEIHFGCRLIDRLSKEAVPTKAGLLLYRYACRLLTLQNETETAIADFQGKIKGRLVIGGSTIPGEYILPEIVGTFTRKYPKAKITLIVGDTGEIIREILEGSIEIGIVGATTKNKQIIQEKLIEDEMCLILPKKHKWAEKKIIRLKALFDEPFIIREEGSGTLKSIQLSFSSKGYSIADLEIKAIMGSTQAVKQGIKNDIGVSILSKIAVSDEIQTGKLHSIDIKGLNLKRNFFLTHHKYRTISPLGKAFLKFLRYKYPENIDKT